MSTRRRTWAAFAIGVLAFTAVPEVFATIQPSGVARADVCVNAGRRVSVSGCTNVADAVAPSLEGAGRVPVGRSAARKPPPLLHELLGIDGAREADTQIAILGPDGSPTPDILYRTPVELWDREMRCLTVLLDPGRLKRGVGPNRELGPPLKAGHEHTLVVGAAMTDRLGQHLPEAFSKRFRATEAVRKAIEIDDWLVLAPVPGTVEPLRLIFPAPLDWGMLDYSIRVVDHQGQPLGGHRKIGRGEQQWSFTPASPWTAGEYRVVVSSELEDVCGNDLFGAFDRDVRLDTKSAHLQPHTQSIPIVLS